MTRASGRAMRRSHRTWRLSNSGRCREMTPFESSFSGLQGLGQIGSGDGAAVMGLMFCAAHM